MPEYPFYLVDKFTSDPIEGFDSPDEARETLQSMDPNGRRFIFMTADQLKAEGEPVPMFEYRVWPQEWG